MIIQFRGLGLDVYRDLPGPQNRPIPLVDFGVQDSGVVLKPQQGETMVTLRCMLFVCFSLIAGASLSGEANPALKKLEGRWEVVPGRDPELKGLQVEFKGDKMQYLRPNEASKDTFRIKVDPSQTPNTIDIYKVIDDNERGPLRGIYSIDGSTLKLRYSVKINAERPVDFSDKGPNRLLTLKKSAK